MHGSPGIALPIVKMYLAGPFYLIEVIHHLDDAVVLEVEDQETRFCGFETSLAGEIVNDPKHRLFA